MTKITYPYPSFFDTDGSPLEDGYVYIGTFGFNPENSPIPIYWDADLTIQAPQPLRTINGLVSRSGSPANVYVTGNYSIIVRDKNRALVVNERNVVNETADISSGLSGAGGSALVGYTQAGTGAIVRTVQSRLREVISAKDFGVTLNGSTDDTTAWNTLLAALPASDFVLVIPPGISRVNSSVLNGIKFLNKTRFQIIGYGATIKVLDGAAVAGNREILYFQGCTDFVVEGLTVDANRATRTPSEVGAHSIVIADSCARGTFRDVVSKNAVVDCWIAYTTGLAATRPTDITLVDCVGDNGWRQGLSIINSIRFKVVGGRYSNTTGSMPQCGIDIEPDSGSLTNDDTIIDGCDLRNNAGFGLQIGGPTDLNNRVIVRNIIGANNAEGLILAGASNGLTLQNIDCGPHSTATRAIIDVGPGVKQLEIDGVRFRGITAGPTRGCIYVHNSVTGRPRIKNVSDIGSTSPILQLWKGSIVQNFTSDGCTSDAIQVSAGTDTIIDGFDISNVTGRALYCASGDTTLRNGSILNSASSTAAVQFDSGSINCAVDAVSIKYSGALPGGAVGIYWNTVPGRMTDVSMRVNGADATPAQLTTFAAGVSGSKIFDCVPNPLSTTATVDPTSLTGPASNTGTVTITGAALGDLAFAAPGVDLNGEQMTVTVSSANTVRWAVARSNAGAFDIASSTWRFWVEKR